MEKLIFINGENEEVEFFVLEETRVQGMNYLLVTDSNEDEEDGECYILKDLSAPEAAEAEYVMVEDEEELDALMKIFSELLEDIEIQI